MTAPLPVTPAVVQQPYIRGSLAERIQLERDAAVAAEWKQVERITRILATTLDAVAAELGKAREMETTIANYQNSSRVVERLLARELVAAADDRKSTLAKINSQRLRNAAFAGVRRAGAR
jgi:ribosomal protein L17